MLIVADSFAASASTAQLTVVEVVVQVPWALVAATTVVPVAVAVNCTFDVSPDRLRTVAVYWYAVPRTTGSAESVTSTAASPTATSVAVRVAPWSVLVSTPAPCAVAVMAADPTAFAVAFTSTCTPGPPTATVPSVQVAFEPATVQVPCDGVTTGLVNDAPRS